MPRRPKKNPQRSVTINLDDDLAIAVDNWMHNFGLDSRAGAAACIMRAGISAVPLDTAVQEISQQAVKEIRKNEFQALADFYEQRANMYRGSQG